MTQNTNNLAAYIWSLADLLRGDFKQSQYGRIILPFTLLRRLECVLEDSKEAVLKEYSIASKKKLNEEAMEKWVLNKACKKSPILPFSIPHQWTSPNWVRRVSRPI